MNIWKLHRLLIEFPEDSLGRIGQTLSVILPSHLSRPHRSSFRVSCQIPPGHKKQNAIQPTLCLFPMFGPSERRLGKIIVWLVGVFIKNDRFHNSVFPLHPFHSLSDQLIIKYKNQNIKTFLIINVFDQWDARGKKGWRECDFILLKEVALSEWSKQLRYPLIIGQSGGLFRGTGVN